MEIFIGNLPGNATLMDLKQFLDGLHLNADFRRAEGMDADSRAQHFFVARTPNRESGMALIAYLDGKVFAGHRIAAREYLRRTAPVEWRGAERRRASSG